MLYCWPPRSRRSLLLPQTCIGPGPGQAIDAPTIDCLFCWHVDLHLHLISSGLSHNYHCPAQGVTRPSELVTAVHSTPSIAWQLLPVSLFPPWPTPRRTIISPDLVSGQRPWPLGSGGITTFPGPFPAAAACRLPEKRASRSNTPIPPALSAHSTALSLHCNPVLHTSPFTDERAHSPVQNVLSPQRPCPHSRQQLRLFLVAMLSGLVDGV